MLENLRERIQDLEKEKERLLKNGFTEQDKVVQSVITRIKDNEKLLKSLENPKTK